MTKSIKQQEHLKRLAQSRKGKPANPIVIAKGKETRKINRESLPIQTKICLNCGKEFTRSWKKPHKSSLTGHLEAYCMFINRKYCSLYCSRHSEEFKQQSKKQWADSNIPTSGKYDSLNHRKIVEQFIGRKLKPSEIIHHINGNKSDNRIENLRIMSRSDHIRLHLS